MQSQVFFIEKARKILIKFIFHVPGLPFIAEAILVLGKKDLYSSGRLYMTLNSLKLMIDFLPPPGAFQLRNRQILRMLVSALFF